MTALPPLLVGMAGGKPRARKAPAWRPKEIKLQVDVANLLRAHCLPDWRWTHFPSGEARDARTGAKLKKMGLQKGWPDFLLLSPYSDRQVHGLELKRIGEELTKEQDEWSDWVLAHGGKYEVAWTMDDVLFTFDNWGCLRIAIPRRP